MLWREREHVGEAQSKEFMTKMTRGRYLRAREVAAKLWVASASSFEARERESYGGGGSQLRAEDGR